MAIDIRTLREQQRAAFAAVQAGLGQVPAEFYTAGELASLMAALPPDTPVHVAETARVDPDLPAETPHHTAAAAIVITLAGGPDDLVDVVDDGRVHQHGPVIPGVELGRIGSGCVLRPVVRARPRRVGRHPRRRRRARHTGDRPIAGTASCTTRTRRVAQPPGSHPSVPAAPGPGHRRARRQRQPLPSLAELQPVA